MVLCELDFATGPFRVWTGRGPLTWAGLTFEGVGDCGAMSEVEETVELRAVRLALTLPPVPQEVIDIVLAERSFRLRPVRLWVALLEMEVVDGPEPRVALACERRRRTPRRGCAA